MSDSNGGRRAHDDSIAREIARALGGGAETSDEAVIVGDRAGVVAWVNAAWSRITGFPTSETVQKPIGHFLDRAGIELELVDFVGRRFVEGLASRIQFPFETFEGRSIRIDLEVVPVRSASGELDAFRATARVLPEAFDPIDRPARSTTGRVRVGARCAELVGVLDPRPTAASDLRRVRPPSPSRRPSDAGSFDAARRPADDDAFDIALADRVRRACKRRTRELGHRIHFDLALDPAPPRIDLSAARARAARQGDGPVENGKRALAATLDDLVEGLLDAALEGVGADTWGTVTLLTGATRLARGHVSAVHPIVARPRELTRGRFLFFEVHDTGAGLDPEALARISRDEDDGSARERALVQARRAARALGGHLHLDSRAGCGSQSLVLLPIAAGDAP